MLASGVRMGSYRETEEYPIENFYLAKDMEMLGHNRLSTGWKLI